MAQPSTAPCCGITAIDAGKGVITAQQNATKRSFQFVPNNRAQINTLRVGEAVYANFQTMQVSLDGKNIFGAIISVGQTQTNIGGRAGIAPPATIGPVSAPPATRVAVGSATPAALPPATSAGAPGNSAAAAAPPNRTSACCSITSINTAARLVAAKDNSSGNRFDFSLPSSIPLQELSIGGNVWANFKTRQVSLDGKTACCQIVSLGGLSTTTAQPKAASGVSTATAQPTATSAPATTGQPKTNAGAPLVSSAATVSGVSSQARAHSAASGFIGSIALSQSSIIGGTSVSGIVTLKSPAGGEPVSLTITSSDPAATLVPNQLQIPAGGSTSNFTVNTSPVASNPDTSPPGIPLHISGSTASGDELTWAELVVLTPVLTGLTLSLAPQDSCSAGKSQLEMVGGRYQVQACVQLSGPAPQGGIPITIANDYADLLGTTFPSSLTIPQGSTSATFTFSTVKPSTVAPVHISASRSPGNYKDAILTLDPAPYLTNVSFSGSGNFVAAILSLSVPPDPSQGDPGTADVSISSSTAGNCSIPLPGGAGFTTGYTHVSVTGLTSVEVPLLGVQPCTLNVTYGGKTLSATY